MKIFSLSHSLEILTLYREAEKALLIRDFEHFQSIMSPLWNDINQTPDFTDLPQQAELLHLAGEFLIYYGKAYNLPFFQSRGKDLMTNAIDLFTFQNQPERALSSQVLLAFAYFQEGGKEEYKAFLLDAESNFTGNKKDISFLRLQINLIISEIETGKLNQASHRVQNNQQYFSNTSQLKLKAQFFLEAGITYRRLRRFTESVSYFKIGLRAAERSRNVHYQTLILNSLANSLRSAEKYKQALHFVDKAITLAENQDGWIANFLDTKALIFYDQKDYVTAEDLITDSIQLFQKGDDFGGLCEALFNYVKILIGLDWRKKATETFIECYQTALERTGRTEADKYLKQFLELTAFANGDNLFEQMNYFQRQRIESALEKSNGKITRAAEILGISEQTLSAMIITKFSDLYEVFEIPRKTRKPR